MDISWMMTIFRKRVRAGALAFAMVMGLATLHYMMQPRIYHSSFTLRVMTEELPGDMKRFEAMLLPSSSSLDTLVNVAQSDKVLQDALQRASFVSNKTPEGERRALAANLRAALKITPDRQANMIAVLVAHPADANDTYKLAKALLEAVLHEEVQSRLQKDEDAKQASLKRSEQIGGKLAKLDLARGRLEKANQLEQVVVSKRDERKALLKEFDEELRKLSVGRSQLEQFYTDDWPEMKSVDRRIALLRSFMQEGGGERADVPAPVPAAAAAPSAPAPTPDPKPAADAKPDPDAKAAAEAKPAPDGKPAAEGAPAAKPVPEAPEMEDLYAKAWTEKGSRLAQLPKDIDKVLTDLDEQLLGAWREEPKYFDLAALNREMDLYRQALDSEEQGRLRLDSKIATTVSNLRVMEQPLPPSEPASPNPRTAFAAAFVLAAVLAFTSCYMLEHFDPALRTVESIQHFTHQSVIGLIPYIDDLGSPKEGYPCRLVYSRLGEGSPACDPYRILKTNVEYAIAPLSNPIILVTSATREEGKSTTAVNLAFAFAEERRTLYVSSNLRRPVGHLFFEKQNEHGLVDVLEGKFPWQEAVQHTQVANLHMITSGRIVDNSAVLLNRAIFQNMLDEARKRYDVVILDSPPVLLVTDAMVLAPRADAVVLVYAIGQTDKQNLVRAIEILGRTKGRLIGIAANAKRSTEVPNRRLYYYTYYPSR